MGSDETNLNHHITFIRMYDRIPKKKETDFASFEMKSKMILQENVIYIEVWLMQIR